MGEQKKIAKKRDPKIPTEIDKLCNPASFAGDLPGKEKRKFFFKAMIETLNTVQSLDAKKISKIKKFIENENTFHQSPPKQWFSDKPSYTIKTNNGEKPTNKSTMLAMNFLNALSQYIHPGVSYSQVKVPFQLLKNNYPTDFIPLLQVSHNINSGIRYTTQPLGMASVLKQTFSGSPKKESPTSSLSPIPEEESPTVAVP